MAIKPGRLTHWIQCSFVLIVEIVCAQSAGAVAANVVSILIQESELIGMSSEVGLTFFCVWMLS